LDLAPRDLHPGVAAGGDGVGDAGAGVEGGAVETRVLVDGQRAVRAVRRDEEAQPVLALALVEAPLLVTGRQAGLLGKKPDLEEVQLLALGGVVLAVEDASPRRHSLHLAGP